ncbi:MAG: hypothetical protein K9K81_11830 [Desulfobacteraceae bacterium]|nr:hypothetical protein [Desulfobacteraceae bacterium]
MERQRGNRAGSGKTVYRVVMVICSGNGPRPDVPRKPAARTLRRGLIPVLLCAVLLSSGCASGKLGQARSEFYQGETARAAATLSNAQDIPKRSRLLYYMEKGTILFAAGQYEESIEALLAATALMSDLEIVSVSRQGGSLVTSERITPYRGEYAERLLVHSYLMMNYLLVRKFDDALVEAKQAMEVIEAYPEACADDYFTRALIAHCFEVTGEINGAYIEYRKLAEDLSDPLPLAVPLYRLASRLGFADEARKYASWLREAGREVHRGPPEAEVIVFAAQGRAPEKIPRNIVAPPSIRFSFVQYRRRSRDFVEPDFAGVHNRSQTRVTTDMTDVLKKSLNRRAARMLAKETARVAAKESIASNMEDPLAETVARIVFFLTEEPDTRAWQTLPGHLSMLRTPLLPGTHHLRVSRSGRGDIRLPEIIVKQGAPRRYYHYAVRFK